MIPIRISGHPTVEGRQLSTASVKYVHKNRTVKAEPKLDILFVVTREEEGGLGAELGVEGVKG